MKHLILLAVIAAIIVPAASLFAAEGTQDQTIEALEKRITIQRMEMELEAQRSEMEFEQEMRQIELDQRRGELENQGRKSGYHGRRHHKGCGMIMLICLVVHILAGVWVYQDIRDKKKGSGMWIVMALLTGLLGTLVYAIVRMGDTKKSS